MTRPPLPEALAKDWEHDDRENVYQVGECVREGPRDWWVVVEGDAVKRFDAKRGQAIPFSWVNAYPVRRKG